LLTTPEFSQGTSIIFNTRGYRLPELLIFCQIYICAHIYIYIYIYIYGPKYENGEWKSRTNRELEEMSKGVNIVKWIKEQRISWLGHLERMEEDRVPKKMFTQELEGTRRRGGPRKGWKEIFKC